MKDLLNRKLMRLLAIALFFGLLVLPAPIPFRVLLLAFAALGWTLLEAGNLRPLGFGRHRLRPTLFWGIGLAVAMVILARVVQPLIEWLMGISGDLSAYGALKGNADAAVRLLAVALTSAAFGEEVHFRGFLLHQLTATFGSGRWARLSAVAASGLAFGLAHFVQGPVGIVASGLLGFVFAWAWFRSDRNLYALILAHALIDSYGIAMLYFGLYA